MKEIRMRGISMEAGSARISSEYTRENIIFASVSGKYHSQIFASVFSFLCFKSERLRFPLWLTDIK